jgi:hypothetical protein
LLDLIISLFQVSAEHVQKIAVVVHDEDFFHLHPSPVDGFVQASEAIIDGDLQQPQKMATFR